MGGVGEKEVGPRGHTQEMHKKTKGTNKQTTTRERTRHAPNTAASLEGDPNEPLLQDDEDGEAPAPASTRDPRMLLPFAAAVETVITSIEDTVF